MKKVLSVLLAAMMIMSSLAVCSITAYADTQTYSSFVGKTYLQNEKMQKYKVISGVDLSSANGAVDFVKLKSMGARFVVLRVGYRGYNSAAITTDSKFEDYYAAAKAAGLDVGVYFMSQALNTEEAAAEAEYVLSKINTKELDLPVYIDYELLGISTGRLDSAWENGSIDESDITDNINAFCNVIRNADFVPGLYSLISYNKKDIATDVSVWKRNITSLDTETGMYNANGSGIDMWQYSDVGSTGSLGSDYFDCDFMYKELMEAKMNRSAFVILDIEDKMFTGERIEPEITVLYNDTVLEKDVDYTVSYNNNIFIGEAELTVTGINKYRNLNSASKTFNITEPDDFPVIFIEPDYSIGVSYYNEAIDAFTVTDKVYGTSPPFTFEKLSGPDWINVSADGTVSGTPAEVGENEDLVVQVSDNNGDTDEVTIPVAETRYNPSKRIAIDTVKVQTNLPEMLEKRAIMKPDYVVLEGSPATVRAEMPEFHMVKGETDVVTKSIADSGTYYCVLHVELYCDYGCLYKFTEDTTVTVDGKEWAVSSLEVDDTSSLLEIKSPMINFPAPEAPAMPVIDNKAIPQSISTPVSNETAAPKTTVTLKKTEVKRSAKKLVLQATVKVDGKAVKGKKVTFKFNGKKYTAKTNKNGVAKVTIKKAVLKKLKVGKKVTFTATYNKVTAKKTVKVKK
ncbi:MAG: hypothetical protein IKF64_02530 [Eubacterium sp.]|nr:hypothetical protein [Eubacterium sp.]